jgi:peptide/nickel transport system substrate-binding protein
MLQRALGCLVLIAFSLFPSYAAEPKRGGSIRVGIHTNPSSLNPFLGHTQDRWVRSLMYEGILNHDNDLDPVPGLVNSWTVSPDGLIYTLTLHPGVKFHNGKPLSSADLKWSIDYTQEPKNAAFGRAELSIVETVEAEGNDRVRVRLKSPYAAFLAAIAGVRLLPVVQKDSIKMGEKPEAFPPGTGPFRFVAWKPGQELRLAKFDGYWQKGLPYLDEVRVMIISDDTSKMNAVRVGDLDMATRIPFEQILRIREGKLPGLSLALALGANHPRMGLNHCVSPFNNPKARLALAYAIDKQEILNGGYAGLGTTTNQKILKGTKWFHSDVPDRKPDPVKARALLAEAGYPDGVKVSLPGWPGTEKELQIIQSQGKKAGFEMTLLIRDFPTHIAALNKGEFQVSFSGGSASSDPDLAYYGFYRTPLPERRTQGGRTQPCYSNKKVDQLLEEAHRATDFQRRRQLYKEVIEILQEEVVDIPIGFVPSGFALQSYVKDFQPEITEALSYGNGGLLKTWLDK